MRALGLTNVEGITNDSSDRHDRKNLVEATVKRFGGIDILIANAAISPGFGGSTLMVRVFHMFLC